MASIGRGRGWAKTTDQGTVLRRPGQSVSPKTCEIDDIANKIYNLDFEEPSVDSVNDIYASIGSLQDLESSLNKLWNLALEDRCFGIKYTKALFVKSDNVHLKVREEIRKSLLRKLQECSERHYELHKENHVHFTNYVWMLGTNGNHVIPKLRKIMGPVLVASLSILLENMTEDDIETVAAQLYLYGMSIKETLDTKAADQSNLNPTADSPTLVDIVNEARHILVNRNVSARSRALLLCIIDLANQQYQPFNGDLQTFYTTVLEPTYVDENGLSAFNGREFNQELFLFRLLSKKVESNENEVDSESAVAQVRKKATQQQAKKVQRSDGTSGPVPRAIRGVGASENAKDHRNKKKSPRSHKDKLTDQEVWSAKQNTSVKVWGHDDRFDNDYE